MNRGQRAAALGEIAEQSTENAAFLVGLNADLDRLVRVERPQNRVQAGERQVDLTDLQQENVAQRQLLSGRQPTGAAAGCAASGVALPDVALADR